MRVFPKPHRKKVTGLQTYEVRGGKQREQIIAEFHGSDSYGLREFYLICLRTIRDQLKILKINPRPIRHINT